MVKAAIRLVPIVALALANSGFVLLGARKATLPVSVEAPTLTFMWDGRAPSIAKRGDFKGGAYEDLDDEAFMAQLLTEAMAIWNDVPGAFVELSFQQDQSGLDEPSREDKIFSIVTASSSNAASAAFAQPIPSEDDPTVFSDCDITIADREANADDLAYTIAHELGHCLGLGHEHTNYNAMMGYSRSPGRLKLGADDIAGLIFLYPDPAYGDGEPKELVCGVAGTDEGPLSPLSLAFSFVLPLAAAVMVARRARNESKAA